MKKVFVLFLLIGFIFSCKKNTEQSNPADLIGSWKLAQVLSDPGDGSGTFHSVSSDKILEFHPDGTITSNGAVCNLSSESNSSTTGTYSLVDSTIQSTSCSDQNFKIRFTTKGSTLTVYYPCYEACAAKFVKN